MLKHNGTEAATKEALEREDEAKTEEIKQKEQIDKVLDVISPKSEK